MARQFAFKTATSSGRNQQLRLEDPVMFKNIPTLAALSLIAVLGLPNTPVGAQSQPGWTQVGMLNCKLNPSIGFIFAGHQSMECRFSQNGPYPPQAYEGALNMVGLDI